MSLQYKSFTIENYRAITGPLVIRLDKGTLMPIIGVNESGKTTILQALFAFDHFNDNLNDGRHLKDVANLYRTSSPPASVTAEIELSSEELKKWLAKGEKEADTAAKKALFAQIRRRKKLPKSLIIKRYLGSKRYETNLSLGDFSNHQIVADYIISYMPYILYFDDFRDKIAEKIEIVASEESNPQDWLAILQQLFKQTDKDISVFKIPSLEARRRKATLSKVQRKLNDTLTKEWQSFRLDDRDALRIAIEYEQDGSVPPRSYIKLEVVETDGDGDEHFFFISDRSKGFYWFFNFVMKLEFNPKLVSGDGSSIYLLDEPGSYLHAFAQRKLCRKLKQISDKNTVIYCTHSHYLLDPEIIPVTRIVIADKDADGSVTLSRISDYKGSTAESRSALQPLSDALEIRPFALDLLGTDTTLIVEGMYDFLSLELFKRDRKIVVLPSVGAGSVKFYVSLMVGWQVRFKALWDNDDEGRRKYEEASGLFGENVAEQSFRLLPSQSGHKRILQNLFEGVDLVHIRESLSLPPTCSFERTIQAFFYSPERAKILEGISAATWNNFDQVFESL